jgi:hypothetical protein
MNKTKRNSRSSITRPPKKPKHDGEICSIQQNDSSVIEFFAQPYKRSANKFGKLYWSSKKKEDSVHNETKEEKKSSKSRILPDVLSNIVARFAAEYRLLPWVKVNIDKLDWDILSRNPNAIALLKNNLDKIN